jgi:hypothetical protein
MHDTPLDWQRKRGAANAKKIRDELFPATSSERKFSEGIRAPIIAMTIGVSSVAG